MSRIGKAPIEVPKGVEVNISNKNLVTVKGPKGTLEQAVDPDITLKQEGTEITLVRPSDAKPHRAKHGLYRALIANMVKGVAEGFVIEQELVGVGYRATTKGQQLNLALGFSHTITIDLPPQIKVAAAQEKGKNPIIRLESADKQLIGQVAAKLRSLRKPEPYKGKGVRFVGEVVRRKAGKAAGK
ncbi:MAG: 50S ribosomal protein L6 [Flavobacteriales bacterium]|jgi:large subunit ribosomal protein L6|nr:50S ribosomal protein L6 [Flavobacteriales bacterium]MBK6550452.1 50S ribosomal protein L6 [Flavobacteriales bacterium]MBK6883000.1 50S ribosomal protein L6 [Flavobacteriales bacterium]MBK7101986.1 50S ribosomal protein L6 [Flavobacteriales bacterium]MBK7114337.1 50S ribosomal protein L6 [Flavobacteriales bacterium]